MTSPTVKRYGEQALLVELDVADSSADIAAAEVAAWAAAIRTADLPDVLDVVPAAQSVVVHLGSAGPLLDVWRTIADLQLSSDSNEQDRPVDPAVEAAAAADPFEIPVTYDGPDLRDVAELSGLSLGDVVRVHTESQWRVAFAGFAPGFAYLVGGDPRLAVPRRTSPRTRVPEGSVALAAGYTAVYPHASPGGWQLIGRTELIMWDATVDPPAQLVPGRRVRFVRADR